ncbi:MULTISPECIES: DUF3606 domain-containing protein [unclassified Sinorhizobium]|uniref:DUF3606 domain-containing protein n=1 Tax=unclassified Sinorhizobium TaxID=2613772 RepID=UPI003523939E
MAEGRRDIGRDRKRVAAGQQYKLSYFRRKHRLTAEQAKEIIKKAGNDRGRANELAEKVKH